MTEKDSVRQRPIAVFDSGVGGLTVLHELLVRLPHEDFVYLGDTANFPYGEKPVEELETYVVEISQLLLKTGAKLLVVACNTATAAGLATLEEQVALAFDVDVITVVSPEAQLAAVATNNGRVGLLATSATVASGAYDRALAAVDPLIALTSVACPDLAPMIQGGFPFDNNVVETVRAYCQPLKAADVDTVIIGCTHYALIAPMLQRMLGLNVKLITAGASIARRVSHALSARDIANRRDEEGQYRFLCTGDVEAFREVGTRFLQMPLGEVKQVQLNQPMIPT